MDQPAAGSGVQGKLGASTRLGRLALNVRGLAAVSRFYEEGVGLTRLEDAEDRLVLGSGGEAVIELRHTPELTAPPPGSAGLYHTAILFEERSDLAAALYATAVGFENAFSGSADHLVSQAFYFNDPEGNGVELYWDRPRAEWRWSEGQVTMDSLPLDPNGFIREHGNMGAAGLSAPVGAAASLGHVHLRVGDVQVGKEFYVDVLGFEVTAAMWQSALFTSAGGYHHHLGMNVWESRGAGVRDESLGLAHFEVILSDEDLAAVRSRLEQAGYAVTSEGGGSVASASGGPVGLASSGPVGSDGGAALSVRDPWGTLVRLREA